MSEHAGYEKRAAMIAEAEAFQEEWRNTPKTVTLTNRQWIDVDFALNHERDNHMESRNFWKELSSEKNEDGSPKYPDAEKFIAYYDTEIARLEEILKQIKFGGTP